VSDWLAGLAELVGAVVADRAVSPEEHAAARLEGFFDVVTEALGVAWSLEVVEGRLVCIAIGAEGSFALAGVVGESHVLVEEDLPAALGREVFLEGGTKLEVERFSPTVRWPGGVAVVTVPERGWALILAAQDPDALRSVVDVVRSGLSASIE
jgi:hypothetical protein